MSESPGTARTLWIDASLFYRVRGNPTGIVRTLSELLKHWRHEPAPLIRYCVFDYVRSNFRQVADYQPRSRLQPATAAPNPRAADRAARAEAALAGGAIVRPGGGLARTAVQAACRMAGLGCRAGQKAARLGFRWLEPLLGRSTAPFAVGDALLVAGDAWHRPDAGPKLHALQRALDLRIAHLIYDIIPIRHPQWCDPRLTRAFEHWLPHALASSTVLLTISEHTRRELLAYGAERGLRVPPIETVRLGDEPGSDTAEEEPLGGADWLQRTFALFVSSIAAYKNQTALLQVWRRLLAKHGTATPHLILVGQPGWRGNEILRDLQAEALLTGHVHHLGGVNDRQLRWLYRRCRLTLYPSQSEGWGLPVAESLIHGKPCIASNASSLPEVAGPLVDYHDPLDVPACQALVERALFDPGWLHQRAERIAREYRVTRWSDCARQTMALLERCLELDPARAAHAA